MSLAYNAQGHLTSVTDPAGRVTQFQYDSTGHKLTTITDPTGRTLQYAYNVLYQITSKTNKAGRAYTHNYANNSQPPSKITSARRGRRFPIPTIGRPTR
jgi:YD repeat-containing protein